MNEPIFQIPAPRGSDSWQEGRQWYDKPASELTEAELGGLDAPEQAFALAWLDRHPNDHEAAVHNQGDEADCLAAE